MERQFQETYLHEPLRRVIAVCSQKGGVDKNTTAINAGAYLGRLDYKALLIDLDPHSSATLGLGEEDVDFSSYSLLMAADNPQKSIVSACEDNLGLVPVTWQLDEDRELGQWRNKGVQAQGCSQKAGP